MYQNEGFVVIDSVLLNVTVTGCEDSQIIASRCVIVLEKILCDIFTNNMYVWFLFARVNPNDYSWETYLYVPHIVFESDYKLNGNIMGIPMNGDGKSKVDLSK